MKIVNLIFPNGPGESLLKEFMVPFTNERRKNLVIVLQLMSLKWDLEDSFNGEIVCSFRENDGTIELLKTGKSEERKPFILYVSKVGHDKSLCSYEIESCTNGKRLLVFNERIHAVDDEKRSRNMSYNMSFDTIKQDIESQLNGFEVVWFNRSVLYASFIIFLSNKILTLIIN